VLVALVAMTVLPGWTLAMLPLALAAIELSPLLALVALLWLVLSWWLLRRSNVVLRAMMIVALLAATALALRPVRQAMPVANLVRESLSSSPGATSAPDPLAAMPAAPDVDERTIQYSGADGSPLTMRLFTNPNARTLHPIVVAIYGGAWRAGDPSQGARMSRALAQHGYLVAAIDYRHAPSAVYPAQIDDVRGSIALVRDSAASWGGDQARLALLGRSAGGHLAELAAFMPSERPPVQAVVALYAPWDLVAGYRDPPHPDPVDARARIADLLDGPPDARPTRYHEASPSSYVRPGLPPTLLLYGARDHLVKPEFNRAAASALWAANDRVVAIELPWSEHGFDLVPGGLGERIAYAAIVRFLDASMIAEPRP